MLLTLAVLCSVGVAILAIVGIAYLQRSYLVVRQLAFPLYLGALAVGLKVFTLFGAGNYPAFNQALTWTLFFLLPTVAILQVVGLFVFDYYLASHRGIRLPPLLPTVTLGLAYIVTALIGLKMAFPGFDVSPILATSAITSLVLGLALQPILGNLFAGVVISLEKPFQINDWIKVGDKDGRVVAITWRTTHICTRENDRIIIPNARIADEQVLNYYEPNPMHMDRIRIGVHYKTPPYRVRQALLNCLTGIDGLLEKPTPEILLVSFDDSAITYEFRVWIVRFDESARIDSEIRTRIWEEFKRDGITIPFPIRTLDLPPRARALPTQPSGAPAPARLLVIDGPDRGATLELGGDPVTIGRSRTCSLALNEVQASKEHLRVTWRDDHYVLHDLGSSFGTLVNGQPATEHVLRPFDRISVGETVMVFESDGH